MTRGLRGATALVAVGAFVAVAIAGPRPAAGAEDDRTLRIGTTQEFDSINPNLAFIGASAEASNLDYDVLVGVGPDGTYVPTGFAESAEVHATITRREIQLKGKRSRLGHRAALENWNQAPFGGQLEYRWTITKSYLGDIANAMARTD